MSRPRLTGTFVALLALCALFGAGCGTGDRASVQTRAGSGGISTAGVTTTTASVAVDPTVPQSTDAENGGESGDDGYYHSQMNITTSYLTGTFTLPRQVEYADIIVYGVVTDVLPGRWNSPDGSGDWQGPKPEDASIALVIYRTFYVEPIETLKGRPAFGTPVAFITEGGVEGKISGPVDKGDRVLVFGQYDQTLYGGIWPEDAYHSTHGEWSIFKETDSVLTNLFVLGGSENQIADKGFDRVTLEDVRAEIARPTSEQQ